jgi:hypothetical protein
LIAFLNPPCGRSWPRHRSPNEVERYARLFPGLENRMRLLPVTIAAGALLAGCADTVGGYGYGYQPYADAYGGPVYPYGGPYGGPVVAAPYPYPPPVVTPYVGSVWVGREEPGRYWHNRPPPPSGVPPQTAWHHPPPQVAPPPHIAQRPPPVAAPPPAAQAQHNRQLLDQMGFRASR